MNLLANAIDAIEDSNQGRSFAEIQANPNQIIIRTTLENEQVKITIADAQSLFVYRMMQLDRVQASPQSFPTEQCQFWCC